MQRHRLKPIFQQLRQTVLFVTLEGLTMAAEISDSQEDQKREPNGASTDKARQQDCEDAKASQKMAEEGGLPQKKNRLPG